MVNLLKTGTLTTTDYTGQDTEVSHGDETLNSPSYQDETAYTPETSKWLYYYKKIPQARAIVETLTKWVFGKGYKNSDPKEIKKLGKIVGNGKETALKVLKNQFKLKLITGDSFAHIIKDRQGRLTNLKPLNPSTIKVIYDRQGIIKRYEQHLGLYKIKEFDVDEIFHLTNTRVGDEMGGISMFEVLEDLLDTRKEVTRDLRTLFHRFVKPIVMYESETDDETEIAKQTAKLNEAYKKNESLVVPKGTLTKQDTKIISTQTGNLSPLEYYKQIIRDFVTACGVPELIMGWSADTTEASAKIVYLAWEQTIEDLQLEIEEDIEAQLNIKINFEFPATIEEELAKDKAKDGPMNGPEKQSEISPSSPQIKKKPTEDGRANK